MKIELHQIPVRDLFKGYKDKGEEGVIAYNGTLDVRPPYQREFVYKDKQREAVIESIRKGFPLNTMYWIIRDDGTYEVLDGQQRTLSVCQYVNGDFSVDNRGFHNLTKEEQEQILDYELMVYFCEGTDRERLDWFEVVNIAGERLTRQEIRNAVYAGPWVTDAKIKFSKNNCAAYALAIEGGKLLRGSPIRQEYLETALFWISGGASKDKDDNIRSYMAKHQHDPTANELWEYFRAVIGWVRKTFTSYRKEMSSVNWGALYNQFKDEKLGPMKLEAEIIRLMMDEDVTKKSGIYPYLLTKEERWLSVRAFTARQMREAYERQKGICPTCSAHFDLGEMQGDHITPWHKGGRTVSSNCQMLCKKCNRAKGGK